MSESNRVIVRTVRESTPGTTPVDDAGWIELRANADRLSATPVTVVSGEILANRQEQSLIRVGMDVAGQLDTDLSHDSDDTMWEDAFASAWSTNVLKIGTTEFTRTIEKEFEDLASDNLVALKGLRCGGFSATWEYRRVCTGSFNYTGTGYELPAASLVGAGSVAARTTTRPFDGSAGMTSLQVDGGAPGAEIRRISLSMNNNLRPIEGLGSSAPADIEMGTAMVTGSISVYLNDLSTFYKRLLDGTEFELSWTTTDVDSNTHAWVLPRCIATGGPPDTPGKDSSVMLEQTFQALYDTTEATTIKLTRSA